MFPDRFMEVESEGNGSQLCETSTYLSLLSVSLLPAGAYTCMGVSHIPTIHSSVFNRLVLESTEPFLPL